MVIYIGDFSLINLFKDIYGLVKDNVQTLVLILGLLPVIHNTILIFVLRGFKFNKEYFLIPKILLRSSYIKNLIKECENPKLLDYYNDFYYRETIFYLILLFVYFLIFNLNF